MSRCYQTCMKPCSSGEAFSLHRYVRTYTTAASCLVSHWVRSALCLCMRQSSLKTQWSTQRILCAKQISVGTTSRHTRLIRLHGQGATQDASRVNSRRQCFLTKDQGHRMKRSIMLQASHTNFFQTLFLPSGTFWNFNMVAFDPPKIWPYFLHCFRGKKLPCRCLYFSSAVFFLLRVLESSFFLRGTRRWKTNLSCQFPLSSCHRVLSKPNKAQR